MPAAARVGDTHTCPMVAPGPTPHVGGPIQEGSPDIEIDGKPAARMKDKAQCAAGGPDVLAMGSGTVEFNSQLAVRVGDLTAHGGVVTVGSGTVEIGVKGDEVAVLPIGGSGSGGEAGVSGQVGGGGGASSGPGGSSAAGAGASSPPGACSITSQTVATVPKDRTRTTIGVGEEVNLTFSPGSASWSTSGGRLSATTGTKVRFTAPDRATSVTIQAVGSSCTAKIEFTVIEPTGVMMERNPGTGTWHTHGIPSVGMRLRIFILPVHVSFENISIIEGDCVGKVTGYFIGTSLDGIHHSGHGAGTPVTVGTVVEGRGSKVDGVDTAQSGHCNFGTPYRNGGFTWNIPWSFRVGTGAWKQFATVSQKFTINTAGTMTVTKGASTSATLNAPTSNY